MNITKKRHHEQEDLCLTRPCYRQGRNLTAVKVYTVSDESTHLLVSNVPAIKLNTELCGLCNRFGDLVICALVPNYENQETFVETYHIQYSRIQCARYAKKQLDGRDFFGEVLHVCYAPELETVNETRSKLIQRRKEVAARIKKKQQVNEDSKEPFTKLAVPVKGSSTQYYQTEEKNENKTKFVNSKTGHFQHQMVNSEPMSGKDLMECSLGGTLNADGKPLINSGHVSSAVSSLECKTNKLSFVPRSLVVRKGIVFHKKNKNV